MIIKKEGPLLSANLEAFTEELGLTQENLEALVDTYANPNLSRLKKELKEVPQIKLNKDPTSIGIQILNEILSDIQAYKSRVGAIRFEILEYRGELDKIRRFVTRAYDRHIEHYMLEESISKLKNVAQQKAAAREMMPLWLEKLSMRMEDLSAELDAFLKLVEAKHEELQDANSNVSRQVTVVQIEANLLRM